MATMKFNNCLVGFEWSGERIRVAAIIAPSSGAGGSRRLRCDEIVVPKADGVSPGEFPPPSRLVPAFKTVLARMGIKGGRAAVALGGSRVVLRYFTGSDGEVRIRLHEATERCTQYIQLGMGDRVVAEHLHRMDNGDVHGVLAVASAAAVDPINKTLEQLGLGVQTIEPALVALRRFVSLTDQIGAEVANLVYVDEDGTDIGIISGAHLLFSRRLQLRVSSDGESEAPDPATMLPREFEKTARHYSRAFGASGDVSRVLMCGPQNRLQLYDDALRESGAFQTHVVGIGKSMGDALGLHAEDLESKEAYAVALGAAAGLMNEHRDTAGLNLSSAPVTTRRPALETLVRATVLPTIVAVGIWGAVYVAGGQLERAMGRMRIEAIQPSPVETKYRELQMELTHIEQRALRIDELTHKFGHRDWKLFLETIRTCVPERLWLTRISRADGGKVTIHGSTLEEPLVHQFREHIDGASCFENATITSTTTTRRGNNFVTEFSLQCTATTGPAVQNSQVP